MLKQSQQPAPPSCLRPGGAARESSGKMISDHVRRAPEGVRVEMRVPRGRRRLRVAEKLADDGEAEARARADRREGVPKIVDAHALEPGVPLDRPPGLLEVGA